MEAQMGAAVIGYGGMGNYHTKVINRVDRLTLSGTFDIKQNRQEAAAEAGFHVYASEKEVLADPNVDIVVIATPNNVHKEIAIRAMEAGKNVICEKPVTLSSADLQEILDVVDKTKKLFVVHQNRRWDEDYLVMKKIYDEKIIGDVFNIEQRIIGSRGIPGDWRRVKEAGGGMMLDWGVHLLDRQLMMVPEKIKKVYCEMSFIWGEEVEDGFIMHLTYESGRTAFVEVKTNNFISLPKWYMAGVKGTATVEDWMMNGKIRILTNYDDKDAKPIQAGVGLTKTMAPRDKETVDERPILRLQTDAKDFYENVVDTLQGKAEIAVKNCEVMRCMRLMEAAFRSGELGQVVPFE